VDIRTTEGEAGFTLIELVVCLAILAVVGAATIGAVAAVARNAVPNVTRDVALMVAENTLVRARAAAAYVPQATGAAPVDPATANLISAQPQQFTAGAQLRASDLCGSHQQSRTLRLAVATSYAANVFTVRVTYPRNPCAAAPGGAVGAADEASVTLSATLAPPLYVPGHVITRTVGVPARM
jgi:prepilin-type N-terminal cleavage/methylation domain-containing protein